MFVKIRSEYFQKKSRKKCEDITKNKDNNKISKILSK